MHQITAMFFVLLFGISISAQTMALKGKVTNQNGKAILGAVLKLTVAKQADTTDALGAYSFTKGVSGVDAVPHLFGSEAISLKNGIVLVSLVNPALVRIELFGMQGNLLTRENVISASAGEYAFDVSNHPLAANMMVIRVTIGKRTSSFCYLPLQSGKRTITASSNLLTVKRLAKTQAISDTLQVSASHYATKSVPITSYEATQDISLDTLNCTITQTITVKPTLKGKAFSGSHQVITETDPGMAKTTIWRPTDLGPGKNYPIVAWGQGGCTTDAFDRPEILGEIASYGYIVLADGTPKGTGGGCGSALQMDIKSGKCLLDAIHFAIRENSRPCSQYYQSLDTSKTAAFGWSCGGLMAEGAGSSNDPCITTFMLNSSGMTNPNQSVIDAFKTPVLFLLGGTDDIAYVNGKRDYDAIKSNAVPAMLLSTGVGHGGTYDQDNGGSFAQVDLAWLNWWLKGDMGATGKGYFMGSTCSLCKNSAWEVKSKNFP